MIIGVIVQDGILLASDTRCMVGKTNGFVGYHDQARKIAISSHTTPSPIACAIACSSRFSAGESVTDSTQSWLLKNRFRPDTPLEIVHSDFEQKYKALNSELGTGFSITSIFAKFVTGLPCLSYGVLSSNILVKTGHGIFSFPEVTEPAFESSPPTRDDAVTFLIDQIKRTAASHRSIGTTIDIVYVSKNNVEWLQGGNRKTLPVRAKDLYAKYKTDPSIITPLNDSASLHRWLTDHSY
jgi:hypothetical protein